MYNTLLIVVPSGESSGIGNGQIERGLPLFCLFFEILSTLRMYYFHNLKTVF